MFPGPGALPGPGEFDQHQLRVSFRVLVTLPRDQFLLLRGEEGSVSFLFLWECSRIELEELSPLLRSVSLKDTGHDLFTFAFWALAHSGLFKT